jgi:hypothetical protein
MEQKLPSLIPKDICQPQTFLGKLNEFINGTISDSIEGSLVSEAIDIQQEKMFLESILEDLEIETLRVY